LPWNYAFRSTFRLYPAAGRLGSDLLDVFLDSDGRTENEVLQALPYDRARAGENPGALPNSKRYRDGRQLLRTVGLVYDEAHNGSRLVRVTEFGRAVARWRPFINTQNAPVLGRHAAQALAACQLRNPTREGGGYPVDVEVFPFSFIWRAMLALDGRITSDELNRAILRTHNPDDLSVAIERIRMFRAGGQDLDVLGEELVVEEAKNDRILVWMAWASFGWTLIQDKRAAAGDGEGYVIAPRARRLLEEAAGVRHRHRNFPNESEYVEHISHCAGLPPDLRQPKGLH
jgi:hypothetical protein